MTEHISIYVTVTTYPNMHYCYIIISKTGKKKVQEKVKQPLLYKVHEC